MKNKSIAEKIKKKFANRMETVPVIIKHGKTIGKFIGKIEYVHRKAAWSTLHFP